MTVPLTPTLAVVAQLLVPARTGLAAQTLPLIADLPAATVSVDRKSATMVIELPAADLPARSGQLESPMVGIPLCQVSIPLNVTLYSARVELLDHDGRALPLSLLHHFNLTDPGRRELFLPIGLHLMAASKETPSLAVPRLVFGLPLERGQVLIAGAMLANESATAYHGVRVRLLLRYMRGESFWPLFRAYPWSMDVMYPLGSPPTGSKAFDLPPGRTVRAWEASPAVPGTMLGLGGHLHDYGVSLSLSDVTTGKVLWQGTPVRDSAGRVETMPLARFYRFWRLGIHIEPSHRYRLEVAYENPTGRPIPEGGMGAVAGLFVPERRFRWPAVDPNDRTYRLDLQQTILAGKKETMTMHMH